MLPRIQMAEAFLKAKRSCNPDFVARAYIDYTEAFCAVRKNRHYAPDPVAFNDDRMDIEACLIEVVGGKTGLRGPALDAALVQIVSKAERDLGKRLALTSIPAIIQAWRTRI